MPAFDAGRRAGLGGSRSPSEDQLAPAWDADPAAGRAAGLLPVGVRDRRGRRLRDARRPADRRAHGADVGRRALRRRRTSRSGCPSRGTLEFQGPLLAVNAPAPPAPAPAVPGRAAARCSTSRRAGRHAAGLRQPPGRAADRPAPTPRRRAGCASSTSTRPRAAAAGLGARIVQERQEQLVAVGLGAARRRPTRCARLERRLELRRGRARLGHAPPPASRWTPGRLLQFLGPAHARVRTSPQTLRRLARGARACRRRSARPRSGARCGPAGPLARRRSPSPPSLQLLATQRARAADDRRPRRRARPRSSPPAHVQARARATPRLDHLAAADALPDARSRRCSQYAQRFATQAIAGAAGAVRARRDLQGRAARRRSTRRRRCRSASTRA